MRSLQDSDNTQKSGKIHRLKVKPQYVYSYQNIYGEKSCLKESRHGWRVQRELLKGIGLGFDEELRSLFDSFFSLFVAQMLAGVGQHSKVDLFVGWCFLRNLKPLERVEREPLVAYACTSWCFRWRAQTISTLCTFSMITNCLEHSHTAQKI